MICCIILCNIMHHIGFNCIAKLEIIEINKDIDIDKKFSTYGYEILKL